MSSLGDYMPNSLMEWSPAIGAGVQGAGALAARMFLSPDSWFARHSEVTGVLAAVLAAGGMALSPSTRGAVGGTIVGAVAAAAPRLIESAVAKAPVAGVAMGLVLEGSRYKVITDILGGLLGGGRR